MSDPADSGPSIRRDAVVHIVLAGESQGSAHVANQQQDREQAIADLQVSASFAPVGLTGPGGGRVPPPPPKPVLPGPADGIAPVCAVDAVCTAYAVGPASIVMTTNGAMRKPARRTRSGGTRVTATAAAPVSARTRRVVRELCV